MYNVSVPITNRIVKRAGREKILASLKNLNAKRIFMAQDTYYVDTVKREEELRNLKENCAYFKENGLEVGAWTLSFSVTGNTQFTTMKTLDGFVLKDCCPLDEDFRRFVGGYIEDIAKTGVDMIMFDDDYRYGFRKGMNCACDKHLALIGEKVGEDLTPDTLRLKALSNGKNKYRDALLEVNGESLKVFAKEMRSYVDRVNPNIRMGVCSCMSLWDNDGVDSVTITKILAGNTKPFLRLIGAPYWAVEKNWGNRLQNIVELIRMEGSWCGEDIEIFSEGDTYPRPRHRTPASYLELYDTALRADGSLDGILKYALDYVSCPDYERGYEKAHCRNAGIYAGIDDMFSGKEACGVRVYEAMNKFADMEIPEKVAGTCAVEHAFFSVASRMLSDNSIPTTYTGEGVCGIAFGENIKMVPQEVFQKGLILDVRAAQILMQQGIDTGITSIGKHVDVYEEYFVKEDEYVAGRFSARVCELADGAEVQSYINYMNENFDLVKAPGAYYYENKQGHRFMVFTCEAYFNTEFLYRSYCRSSQLAEGIKWLTGKALPVYCFGNPDLYLMCKKDTNTMSVGLWNMFADAVDQPVVELEEEYQGIRFLNCNGRLEGNKVVLEEIRPFAFAAFEVSHAGE